jgi:hypothetical protein
VATLFPRLVSIPGISEQVQLTELIFLGSLFFFWREIMDEIKRLPALSIILGGYILVNLVSAVFSGSSGSILEALGRGYLGVLLFMAAAHVKEFGVKRLYALWMWGTMLVSVAAVVAYATALFGSPFYGSWVAKIPDYPYFGDLYRLRGSGQTYGMFFMLLLPGYFMAFNEWRAGRIMAWPVLIILAATGLTFGKEVLLIPIGHLLSLKRSVAWPKALAAGLVMVLLIATHFLLVDENSKLSSTAYVNRPVAKVNNYQLMETNYTENKRAAIEIFSRNWMWGVGPGQFAQSTVQLVEEGRYPENSAALIRTPLGRDHLRKPAWSVSSSSVCWLVTS